MRIYKDGNKERDELRVFYNTTHKRLKLCKQFNKQQ